jgi:hypothetical protein
MYESNYSEKQRNNTILKEILPTETPVNKLYYRMFLEIGFKTQIHVKIIKMSGDTGGTVESLLSLR